MGFVSEKIDGSSKSVTAITLNGVETYETFFEENEDASIAAAEVGEFVVITPSKTFDTDETIYRIQTMDEAGTYVKDDRAYYAAYDSDGYTLQACDETVTLFKDFHIDADALIIRKTVKDDQTSYASTKAGYIEQFAKVTVYTTPDYTLAAKLILFDNDAVDVENS